MSSCYAGYGPDLSAQILPQLANRGVLPPRLCSCTALLSRCPAVEVPGMLGRLLALYPAHWVPPSCAGSRPRVLG